MIHVIATAEVREGRREEFLQAFRELMPHVHAEEGCIEYGPAVDVAASFLPHLEVRDNVVVIIEKWESLAHLQAHLQAPHMGPYREKVKDMVVGTSLQVMETA